jgi:hypothetical protein
MYGRERLPAADNREEGPVSDSDERASRLDGNSGYGKPFLGGSWPEGLTPGEAISSYPESPYPDNDLYGGPSVNPLERVQSRTPLERLKAEVEAGRAMYRSIQAGDTVDYVRLAGMLANTLDNVAYFTEWMNISKGVSLLGWSAQRPCA